MKSIFRIAFFGVVILVIAYGTRAQSKACELTTRDVTVPNVFTSTCERTQTPLDLDHQFDSGSGVVLKQLTTVQIGNLATLGRVWGFLKYHHPQVTSGHLHWDYELFRVLPAILEAPDREAANGALLHWITKLSDVALCNPCVELDERDLDFGPDVDWIADEVSLGRELSQRLRSIRNNRVPGGQFYVSKVTNIGNPSFDHELGYEKLKLPDAGFQLLSLYRFWNIIEYWSPYRDVMGVDWNNILTQFIPRVALAGSAEAYQRELLAFIANAHDGHANLWTSLAVRPPVGKCQLPVEVRFAENLPVISGLSAAAPNDLALKIGDVITELDGAPLGKLIENWRPYYATSNDAALMRDIGHYMTRGDCGEAIIGIHRENRDFKVTVKRVTASINDYNPGKHDLPGPAFRLVSKEVAYLKLSSVKEAECTHYIEEAAGTKGLIIDIRNYPSEFVVFALGSHLVEKETEFVRFTEGDLANPGAFHWTKPLSLSPDRPPYAGKIVILVDESSMSQAEYTSMAFRSAHGAMVIGSTTSGADGNVSPFALPGGLHTMISGIGLFYPDKTATQRIGIKPSIEVRPTVAGIRAGRDEVLEEALRQILGRRVPASEIEKMARP